MKKYLWVIPLAILLCSTSAFGKEWSAEQKEALNAFNRYIAASLKGNVEELMAFFHPRFLSWDYGQKLPTNYPAYKGILEEFYATHKMADFAIDPLEIQVEDNIGVLHLRYEEKFSDSTGKETTGYGPITVTMLKKDSRWVFLSFCWLEKFEGGK